MINRKIEFANDNLTLLFSLYEAGKCIISDRFGHSITMLFPLGKSMSISEDPYMNRDSIFFRSSGSDLDLLVNFDFRRPNNITIKMSGESSKKHIIRLPLSAKKQPIINELETRFWDADIDPKGNPTQGVYLDWSYCNYNHYQGAYNHRPNFNSKNPILEFPVEGHFFINDLEIGALADPDVSNFSKIRIGRGIRINKTLFENVEIEESMEAK